MVLVVLLLLLLLLVLLLVLLVLLLLVLLLVLVVLVLLLVLLLLLLLLVLLVAGRVRCVTRCLTVRDFCTRVFSCSLRTIESVLPSAIEWGPTVFSHTVTTIPERMDAVRAPPRDVFGRETKPEEATDPVSGLPLVPSVLWIGEASTYLSHPAHLAHLTLRFCPSPRVRSPLTSLLEHTTTVPSLTPPYRKCAAVDGVDADCGALHTQA
jgi:hypothetical protein